MDASFGRYVKITRVVLILSLRHTLKNCNKTQANRQTCLATNSLINLNNGQPTHVFVISDIADENVAVASTVRPLTGTAVDIAAGERY